MRKNIIDSPGSLADSFGQSLLLRPALVVALALLLAPRSEADTKTFQQNIGGYAGLKQTTLFQLAPGNAQVNGGLATGTWTVDGGNTSLTDGQLKHGLLWFDSIFGSGPTQIPPGSTITSATITANYDDQSGSSFAVYRMLQTWSPVTATWNSFTNGVQNDGVEAFATATTTFANPNLNAQGTYNAYGTSLTADVQLFSNGTPNFGWVVLPTVGTSGWGWTAAQTNSAILSVTFTPPVTNQPLAVSITSPLNNATVGASFTIDATATVSPATITSVTFKDGATTLGVDTTAPYSFSVTGAAIGAHALTAVALDSTSGTATSAVVNVTVVNLPPTVSITSPAEGALLAVGSNVTISANAADDGAVTNVEFFVDNVSIGTDNSAPYTASWNSVPLGNHVLKAVASDGTNTTTSTLVNVSVTNGPVPLLSQNFSTDPVNYTLTGAQTAGTSYFALSNAAGITLNPNLTGASGVYFTMQAAAANPCQMTFNPVSTAGYSNLTLSISLAGAAAVEADNFIRAVLDTNGDGSYETTLFNFTGTGSNTAYHDSGTLNLGDLSAAFRTITGIALPAGDGTLRLRIETWSNSTTNENNGFDTIVISGTPLGPIVPPTVALTAPADGSTVFIPGTTALTANANDTDGTVTKVEFFDGATKLGEDTTAPYSFVWTPVGLGAHSLTAKATDNGNNTTTSAPVNVTAVVNPNQTPVVTPTFPADQATGISNSTNVTVGINDPEGGATTVTFYGRKCPPTAPGPDFHVIAIPDTQYYAEDTGRNPGAPSNSGAHISYFNDQTNWITANRVSKNVAFVAHMGDMVQNGDSIDAEWVRASGAMFRIEDPTTTTLTHGIPWGGAPGNHDFGTGGGSGTTAKWNQYFGATRWAGRTYFQGNYGINNNNNYQFFSASGLDFIVINIAYRTTADTAVHDWADALLKAYPNRRAIVTSHWIIGTGNPATFGGQGQALYDNLKDNPNLFLMLCGHVHGEGRRTDTFQGRDVYSILQDYQDGANGGNGFLRTLKFSPANNTITAEMFSPTLNRTATTGDVPTALGTFTLPYSMQAAPDPFVNIGTVNVAAGGTSATLSWTGLEPGSCYEWYATANDGVSTGTGSVRSFSTVTNAAPAVAITAPANNDNFNTPATISISANATDDGSITKVEFFQGSTKLGEDASAPYEFSWGSVPSGSYVLTALATDNFGASAVSAAVNITVTNPNNVLPSVSITAPSDGAAFAAGGTVNISANATDTDGTITKVEFYNGAVKLGEDTTAPSPFTYALTNVAEGNYILTAKAFDNDGGVTTSAPVSINVAAPVNTTLIAQDSVWKFLDNGSDQGTAWRAPAFDDSTWASGPAELGYGDAPATTISFGPDTNNKYITTYFRRTFTVANPGVISTLSLNLVRDDGAVIYLNGTEIGRSNMNAGTVNYLTLAPTSVGGADESAYFPVTFSTDPVPLLVAGTNVLAVEIHQNAGTSSDVSFNLELLSVSPAGASGTLTRSPYLNMANHNSIVVRWNTSLSVIGRVRYGLAPDALTLTTDELIARTKHEVRLTGLTPYTRYYYSVGSATDTLTPETSEPTSFKPVGTPLPTAADYTFRTSPVPGTAVNTRVWIIGDCGRGSQAQADAREAYYNFTGARTPDLNLQLGDNAYNTGTNAEYQSGYFNMYANTFRKMPQWSTLGNHDDNIDATTGTIPYFDMFTFPTLGECGGVASGSEHYYSYDYGNIHFICLDSQASDTTVDNMGTPLVNEDGPMAAWLRQDLQSTTSTWIIAFWHHPPYSKGSHDSDTEGQLVNMRSRFNPILENGGVDVVFCGHSHNYERSVLLDTHYGDSNSIIPAMKMNAGNGSPTGFTTTGNGKIRNAATSFTATATTDGAVIPGDGAYIKPLTGPRDHFGAVYNTAGMSGLAGGGSIDHSAMYVSYNNMGTVNLDVNGNTLTCTFVQTGGSLPDNFTIIKQGFADSDSDGIPDAYEIANGLDRYTADDAADLDSDTKSNFDEYAFGTDPQTNGGAGSVGGGVSPLEYAGTLAGGGTITKTGQPIVVLEGGANGANYRALFVRRRDYQSAKLKYIPEFSADLSGSWHESNAPVTVLAQNAEYEIVSVPYTRFIAGRKARWFHVRVIKL